MKKVGLFLLALVLVAGFMGCGGDDDDDGVFNFDGHWAYQGSVVESNNAGLPVGTKIIDVATVSTSGTEFTLDFPGDVPPYRGTCDPVAGTFQATVVHNGITLVMSGHKVDKESMAGQEVWTKGSLRVVINWAATLESRNVMAPIGASRDALLEVFANAEGKKR